MSDLPRSLFVFGLLCLLAIVLGVMLATPLDTTTLLVLSSCLFLLLTPILLKYHHTVLIVTWNALISLNFLPGEPYLWMIMAGISFGITILTRALQRNKAPSYWVGPVAIPLILLGILAFVTGKLNGGIGTYALGSQVYGGKRYFYVWAAIIGYFAFTFQPITYAHRQKLSMWFFLSGLTAIIGTLAYWLGPKFYFLFLLFPADYVWQQALTEQSATATIQRLSGLLPAMWAVTSFLLLRYGIRGLTDIRHPFRIAAFCISFTLGLLSGFRSYFVLVGLALVFQFFAEGLYKTKYLPVLALVCVTACAALLPFTDRLPLAVQRTLTLFPVKVDPLAEYDAKASLEWRLEMWRVALQDVPKYFWVGKGYAQDPTSLFLAGESVRRGNAPAYTASLAGGDYHNGPLSVQLPFGIFGTLLVLWFFGGAIWVLRRNAKYGDPAIQNINTFLLACFIARIVYFVVFFGALFVDLMLFTGIVGLSVSLNRGVSSKRDWTIEESQENEESRQGMEQQALSA